jgi:hypothetical protein
MEPEPELNKNRLALGRSTFALGWVINFLSLWFCLESKDPNPPHRVHLWVCVAILGLVAASYTTARLVSGRLPSRAIRSYLSPYLVGATCWLGYFSSFSS